MASGAKQSRGRALDLALADSAKFAAEFRPGLLNGVVVLKGKASVRAAGGASVSGAAKGRDFRAVPYYAWANRGAGETRVWFPKAR